MTESDTPIEPSAPETPERNTGDNVRASWPFSLHQIRANTAHCSPDRKEALISAFLWCTDAKHPISKPEFARRVGYSDNVIYKIFSGKYTHPDSKKQLDIPDDLVSATRKFIAIERERFLGGKNEFVMTPTAKRVWVACDLARESQTPVFLTGRSHIGKTWALDRYTTDNNHGRTVMIRMKAASGLGGMVRRMCEALGISPNSNTANLVDYIKHALTPDMLIIFDELHLLMYTYRRASFFACLEVIREIYDESGCGMVLCGTRLLLEEIHKGKSSEMEQLLRRGVHRIHLPEKPTRADVTAILENSGLDFPKKGSVIECQGIEERPYEVLRMLASKDGLKAITERLRYARKLAARADKRVNWHHFVEAHLTIETETTGGDDWD